MTPKISPAKPQIVTLEPCKKPLSVGDRVECKHTQSDPLYYAGVVTAFWDGTDKVLVRFTDDGQDRWLPKKWVDHDARQLVGEDSGVLATDGHVMLRGVKYSARMLSFEASPQLYQSGVLLDEHRNPCFDQIPFEITQVFHVAGAVLAAGSRKDCRVAMIGGGAGTVAMGLQQHFSTLISHIDLVELSPAVMRMACACFGLRGEEAVGNTALSNQQEQELRQNTADAPNCTIRMHTQDGVEFLKTAPAETIFDAILIDAADSDAACDADLEAPPESFLEAKFLQELRARVRNFVAINVIANSREMLLHVTELFEAYFPVVRVLAIDPNYVFFLFVDGHKASWTEASVLASIDRCPGLGGLTHLITGPLIGMTQELVHEDGKCLGWLHVDELKACLDDSTIVVY